MIHLIHLINILLTENCHDDIRVEALREIRKILSTKQRELEKIENLENDLINLETQTKRLKNENA